MKDLYWLKERDLKSWNVLNFTDKSYRTTKIRYVTDGPWNYYFFLFPLRSGRRRGAEEPERAASGSDVVAVRLHHHRLVHRQLGRLPHRLASRHADRVARRPVQAVQGPLRARQRHGEHDLLRAHGLHRVTILRVSTNLWLHGFEDNQFLLPSPFF